ncbi:MAG: helix-hairpin-helix domain-containing protein, partial [Dehalococcoidales bacterium]|nr:helix-hairpin-helix domain-containing protein [Dehalococcoidales bacterium]
ADRFGSVLSLAKASKDDLESTPTIGPKISDSVLAYFGNEKNKNIIEKLDKAGVSLSSGINKTEKELPLAGLEFVITGKLETLSRQEAEEKIKALGGNAKSDVTRKTNFLVIGAEPGSKLDRAKEIGIKQINESELLGFLKIN